MKSLVVIRIFRNRHLFRYCVESLLELTVWKILILCLPFRRWSRWSGRFQSETLKENRLRELRVLRSISRSIQISSQLIPWRSKCLDQALAAQDMLARRKLPSTVYYGMVKDDTGKWLAHAWVRCGDQWVIGHHPQKQYTVVGSYAKVL